MYLPVNLNLGKWYVKTLSPFLLPDICQLVYSYNRSWFDHVSHLEIVGRAGVDEFFTPFPTASGWIVGDIPLFPSAFKLHYDEECVPHEARNMDGDRVVTLRDVAEHKISIFVRDALTGDVLYGREFAYDSEGIGRLFSSPRQHTFGFYECSKERFLIFNYMNQKTSSLTKNEFVCCYKSAVRILPRRMCILEHSQIKWISTTARNSALSFVWRNSIVYRMPTDLEQRLVPSVFYLYAHPHHSHPPLIVSGPSEGNRGSGFVWKVVLK